MRWVELRDAEAETFDDAADHQLVDPHLREASRQLPGRLPAAPASIADLR